MDDDFMKEEQDETHNLYSMEYLQDLEYRYSNSEEYIEMIYDEINYEYQAGNQQRYLSEQYLAALYYAKNNNLKAAKDVLTDIAFEYEMNSIFHELYLGQFYIYEKDMHEAKRLFDRVYNFIPKSRYINEGYAQIHLNRATPDLFDPQKAIVYALRSLSIDYYQGHMTLAEAYLKNGETRKSLVEIDKALEFRKIHSSDVILQLCCEYADKKQLQLKKKLNSIVLKNQNAKYMIEDYLNCTYAEFLK